MDIVLSKNGVNSAIFKISDVKELFELLFKSWIYLLYPAKIKINLRGRRHL